MAKKQVQNNKLKILMVTSEAVPFAKSGGLGDMVSALALALADLGHDVRLVMPRYYSITTSGKTQLPQPLGVPVGWGEQWCAVYTSFVKKELVPVYFLDHERYFGRQGIYGATSQESYDDNAERYTFLSRGALQLCKTLRWQPDIVHSHDWPSALVSVYLKTWEKEGFFAKTASIFTIHNLGYQGWFDKHQLVHTQLSWHDYFTFGLERHGGINLMQAGIVSADAITTVSPTYAKEIQQPQGGFGLDRLLSQRRAVLHGILNGVDYTEWNPEADRFIAPLNYSVKNMGNKAKVKALLQQEMGLPVDAQVPVFGMVTRFAEQKGLGELIGPSHGSLYRICQDMAVQFVVVGTGESWCEQELRTLQDKLPNLRIKIVFDNRMAHLVEAGSDFFLMPSRYEPCGLNQMYSLRYGTLPIVRATGGLADTVVNYDEKTGSGTGFMFYDLTPQAIYDSIGWATWAYYNKPKHIQAMRQQAMSQNFDWSQSAQQYIDVYTSTLGQKNPG
jgi:starch synthase